MEQKLQLDKRVSFLAAAGTVLDPTTPSRSTQQWASTPTTIEVSSPVQVAEQQTQQTDVFWMTPIIELFAKLTNGDRRRACHHCVRPVHPGGRQGGSHSASATAARPPSCAGPMGAGPAWRTDDSCITGAAAAPVRRRSRFQLPRTHASASSPCAPAWSFFYML